MTASFPLYNKERLSLFDQMLQKGIDIGDVRLWLVEPSHMRFCLGESIRDMKVPYYIGTDDELVVRNAILSLATLIKKRLEPVEEEEDVEGGISYDQKEIKVSLLERVYRTDIFIQDSLEKIVATEMLAYVPYLDAGILRSWLAMEGYGKAFVDMVRKTLEKAIEEEIRQSKAEKTSYLALLAIVNATRREKELLKNFRIKGFTYEKLEMTISLALYFLLKAIINEALLKCFSRGISYDVHNIDLLLFASLTPQAFLYIQPTLLSSTLNPYRINEEVITILAEDFDNMHETDKDIASITDKLVKTVSGNKGFIEVFERVARLTGLREVMISYLIEYDTQRYRINRTIQEISQEDRFILAILNDQKRKKEFIDELEDLQQKIRRDFKRVEGLENIKRNLISPKRYSFLSRLRKAKETMERMIRPTVEGYVVYRLDSDIEKLVEIMRGALINRKDEFSRNTLADEYERGRLYRFSSDERPILKALEVSEEGFLFIDMKDFTRKMLKVKEIAMAEFLKDNFFGPMLEAASRYRRGSDLLEDVRGISLDNLVGDGALFSGGIVNLVSLAHDIQRITSNYREQLKKRLLPLRGKDVFSREGGEVERRDLAWGGGKDAFEEAIEQVIEVGLFITYGKKAETLILHGKKGFIDETKVAIGESINEAARGAYRNSVVMVKHDMMLEKERRKRGNPNLTSPFRVHTGLTYGIRMTPELDTAIGELTTSVDSSRPKELAQVIANETYHDLKKLTSDKSLSDAKLLVSITDIYNNGHAMSGEALMAYINESKGVKRFFKKVVDVEDLCKDIKDNFFIPFYPLEIWVGLERRDGVDIVDIFCKIGEVIFKGFEMAPPTVVYEMMNREGDFYKLIMRHHYERWVQDALGDY